VDGEPLLASAEPSDNVIAILARLKDSHAAVRRILENLSKLPREKASEYFQALLIIAGLRGLEEAVQQEAQRMFTIDLSENKVLGPVYLQGQLGLLRQQIERKFGTLPEWVDDKLSQLSAEEVKAVGFRVLEAASLEDLFR
jgi:hypothetical protein